MPEPSQFIRVNRIARYTIKESITISRPSHRVDKAYAKKHPSQIIKSTRYTAKKTTKTYKKGQSVTRLYAKRFPKLVKRTTIYRSKPISKTYKKGTPVSVKFAEKYPNDVRKQEWMVIQERQPQYDPVMKRQVYGAWKITSRQKMNFYEQILPVKNLSSRHIRITFARNRVFNNIWQNHKGIIRMTINGMSDGRRVKDVVHIGYLKSVWEHKHNGYEQFKNYVVNKVLQGLRRHHLRLSNQKESQDRLIDLRRKLKDAYDRFDNAAGSKRSHIQSAIKELKKLIVLQKQSRQVTGATIRIEKLVDK